MKYHALFVIFEKVAKFELSSAAKNIRYVFHENRLPADDSHEISCLF